MYQRQVWKQLLSNKVLIDPKTQKFFKTSDLHDLFSLQEEVANPETANIFRNSRVSMQERMKEARKKKKSEPKEVLFSEDKIQAMKSLAQQIAKSIAAKNTEEKTVEKSSFQIEVEEERQRKLAEKETLKTLTPVELRELNRKKMEKVDDDDVNKIDDFDTNVSFSKALEVTEKTAQLYTKVKKKRTADKEAEEYSKLVEQVAIKKKEKSRKEKTKEGAVDRSGKVDGEVVEGLLKREVKRHKEKEKNKECTQDDYVLSKLFNKKGE